MRIPINYVMLPAEILNSPDGESSRTQQSEASSYTEVSTRTDQECRAEMIPDSSLTRLSQNMLKRRRMQFAVTKVAFVKSCGIGAFFRMTGRASFCTPLTLSITLKAFCRLQYTVKTSLPQESKKNFSGPQFLALTFCGAQLLQSAVRL